MPGAGLEILNKRIRSVKNTQQITKAMKMVAAAKLQRSQGKMLAARPYAEKLAGLMQQLANAADLGHPLFEVRPVTRRLVVVVTSDKGLCGAYNQNIIKLAQKSVDASIADGVETELYAIGRKAADHFSRRQYKLFAAHDDFGGEATAERGQLVGTRIVEAFLDGTFDEVSLVYSRFISTMTQKPIEKPLLPIAPEQDEESETSSHQLDYIWEPSREKMFELLVPLYLRLRAMQSVDKIKINKHAARMTSMTAATENAGELIDYLTLKRNRERQAAITAELLDIVGGANAL